MLTEIHRQQAWTIISMDFIEGLPKSHNYDTILVVIDKFSKYGHFVPMKHPYTALTVAKLFMDNVYKLHGLPQVIISDRDKVFTSELWKELFRLADTTVNLSSAYHPQTDGQTERLNHCLETYLRCMVHACPTKWFQWLSQAEKTGIIPPITLHWAKHLLKCCMLTHLDILGWLLQKHVGMQIWINGWQRGQL
jgi:hypothetical protein